MITEAQLHEITAQAIALVGSQERLEHLKAMKYAARYTGTLLVMESEKGYIKKPETKNFETEYAATLEVISDIKASHTPLEQAQATIVELKALTHTLGASESSLLSQVAALTAENVTLKTEQATIEASVETRASSKALVIAGGQGCPPLNVERGDGIKAKVTSADEEHSKHFAAYAAITDPKARGEYYEKHLASAFKD